GMNFALIRKGDFQMGSEELISEKPPHPVRITKDFYLAIHPVTVGQFRAFVRDTKRQSEAEKNGQGAIDFRAAVRWLDRKPEFTWKTPGFEQGEDHPVVCVSWNDAVAFCKWL